MRAAPAIMTGMFPIIRRKRRPLIVAEVPPVAAGPVQPVAAMPLVESVPVLSNGPQVEPATQPQPKKPDECSPEN